MVFKNFVLGIKADDVAHGALLDAFARQGDVDSALHHLQNMPTAPTTAHHNAILRAFARKNDAANAQRYLEEWLQHFENKNAPMPDLSSFTVVIASCGSSSQMKATLHAAVIENKFANEEEYWLSRLRDLKLRPDLHLYCALVSSRARNNDPDGVNSMMKAMQQDGIKPNGVIYASIVSGFAAHQNFNQAEKFLDHGERILKASLPPAAYASVARAHCRLKKNLTTFIFYRF